MNETKPDETGGTVRPLVWDGNFAHTPFGLLPRARKATRAKTPLASRPLNQSRVRMTLDLSQRLNGEIERLANSRQTSKADILRFAVEFLAAAISAKEAGMTVGAWSDGTEREFIGL